MIVTHSDINDARKNPEFLEFLLKQEEKAIEEKNIPELYQVLDSLLILNLDEQRVHTVYQEILKNAFDKVEEKVNQNSKLTLDGDDIFLVRAFYEHAIEKWSIENYDGAKELFFVLSQIIDDEFLEKTVTIHMIATAQKQDIDTFYNNSVAQEQLEDEKYGYFITNFQFDKDDYLEKNRDLVKDLYDNLKHLVVG
jgi:hypothetical protein